MKEGGTRGGWPQGGRCGGRWRRRRANAQCASAERQTGQTERDTQGSAGATEKPSGKQNVNDAESSSTGASNGESQMEAETSGRQTQEHLLVSCFLLFRTVPPRLRFLAIFRKM